VTALVQFQQSPTLDVWFRFWKKVEKTSGCWYWNGAISDNGYGNFYIPNENRKTTLAHVLAYRWCVGPIPDGKHLDHLCRTRRCVNPEHLEPVTCKENLLRGIGPTAMNASKTHCKHGHPFTPENTYFRNRSSKRPTGGRKCRICIRNRWS
jgi:hypothetical protein